MICNNIKDFKSLHGFLICMDSDGTVIDAMNAKHIYCHLPAFMETFGLYDRAEEAKKLWNKINLFEKTRGSNRYTVMSEVLSRAKRELIDIDDIKPLISWVNSADELSEKALLDEIGRNDCLVLRKMLEFSRCTDSKLAKLDCDKKPPFKNAAAFLKCAYDKADLAVVSGSTSAAVIQEWEHFGLLQYLSIMTTCEHGTKADRLRKLSLFYQPGHVLMIGDAAMDMAAAEEAGIYFYPITAGKEEESWKEFQDKYFGCLIDGTYGKYSKQLNDEFISTFE